MSKKEGPPNTVAPSQMLLLAQELAGVLPREKLFRGSGLIGDDILFVPRQYRIVSETKDTLSMELIRKVLRDWKAFELGGQIIDRNPMPHWIHHLEKEMLHGRFAMADLIFAYGTCDEVPNVKFRYNGQNTAWALDAMFERYPDVWNKLLKEEKPTIRHYHAKTGIGARAAYCSLDCGKYRTKDQKIVAILVGTPEFAAFRPRVVTMVATGLSSWKWKSDGERTLQSAEDVADVMRQEHDKLCLLICTFLNSEEKTRDTRHIYRSPVVAGMFATANVAPQHFGAFWASVRDGLNFTDRKDPRAKLRNELLGVGRVEGTKASGHRVHEDLMYCWVNQAWNAWCRSNSVNFARKLPDGDWVWLKPKSRPSIMAATA